MQFVWAKKSGIAIRTLELWSQYKAIELILEYEFIKLGIDMVMCYLWVGVDGGHGKAELPGFSCNPPEAEQMRVNIG